MIISERTNIARSPSDIFAYLNDVENRKDYIPALDEVIMIDPLPLGVGSRYIEVARIAGRDFKTTYQITEFLENKKITAKTIKSVFPIEAQLDLEELNENTKLTITLQLELKGIFKLVSGIIQKIVRQQSREILIKIKNNLEAS